MNITHRIAAMKKLEPKFNRTEFKILFALAAVEIPLSKKELSRRTGLGNGRIEDAIKGLRYFNTISELDEGCVFNDEINTWKIDLLNGRNLYATQPPVMA